MDLKTLLRGLKTQLLFAGLPLIALAQQAPIIKTFPLGTGASGAYAIVAGDVNGDGIPDLITSNNGSSNISVLLGQGRANFGVARDYATGSGPKSLAIGDFNKDGKLDVVTANFNDGTISVLFGNGDGSFQAHQDFSVGIQTQSVAVGDVNNDGIPDMVVSSVQSENTDVFLSNGDGTFQEPLSFVFNNGYAAWTAIALGDMNNDGILDFVGIFGFGQGFQVWLGRGDGTFSLWSKPLSYGTIAYPNGLGLGDFNGDGRVDVALGLYTNNQVGVSLNETDGYFSDAIGSSGPSATILLAVADLNGDGKLDTVSTGLNTNLLEVGLSEGNGQFQNTRTIEAGAHPVAAVAGFFSGHKLPDIAFATSNSVGIVVR